MRTRPSLILLILMSGLALTACHKENAEPEQNEAMENISTPAAPEVEPAPPLTNAATTEAPKVKPALEPSAEQQILDDADATGMTSRTAREDTGTDAAGNSL